MEQLDMEKRPVRQIFRMAKKSQVVWIGLCCGGLYIGLCLWSWQNGHNWGGDFAAYLMQGEAIAKGDWELLEAQATFRHDYSIPRDSPEYYPWGFPLLMAPFLSGDTIPWTLLKYVMMVYYLGALWIFLLWISKQLFLPQLWLLGIFWAVHPFMIDFKDQILSDYPFLFWSILALYTMQQKPRENVLFYIWMGIWVACAVCTRTQG
ncbi:MAG: hypothetical protein AAFR59_05995, partial [Bacteroidota bacterium]